MASHHHPHQPHLHRSHLPTACCCGGDYHSSPPPPSPSDPLLQALASQILQSAQFQHHSQYPTLRSHKFQPHYQFQPLNFQDQKRVREQHIPQVIHHSTVSSLLSRIEALEFSLHRVSGSHVPPQSLRHVAASTIQTHFRAFLVRRSRALGELKDLAIIKSRVESLQSALCNEFYVDRHAISLEVMDLLLHLDSIQGNDPMVKDSKKFLSGDLVQFFDRIDNFTVRRNALPLKVKAMKNLRLGQNFSKSRGSNPKLKSNENQKETIEKLKSRVEKICERSRVFENDGKDLNLKRFHHVGDHDDDEEEEEDEEGEESPRIIIIKAKNQTQNRNLAKCNQNQPRVKKSVRFAENGSLSRVLGSNSPHEDYGVLDERDSSDEVVEEDSCNEAMEIKENQKGTIEKLKSRVEKICERSRVFENDGTNLNLKRFHHVGDHDHDDDDDDEEEEESPRIIVINDKNQTQIRQPRVRRSVRFAENGSLSRVLGSNNPHGDYGVLDEMDSSDEVVVEDSCNEAMEIKEFSELVAEEDDEEANEDGESLEVSDGERNNLPRRKMMSSGNGGSAFSAPLPLKMENKADLMKKNRKSIKILG